MAPTFTPDATSENALPGLADAIPNALAVEHITLLTKNVTVCRQPSIRAKAQTFVLAHFLPIGFAAALLLSVAWSTPGKILSDIKVGGFGAAQSLCVCIIFLVSGLCFKTSDIRQAIQSAQGVLFGVISILIVTPLSGFLIMELDFISHAFRVDMCIFVSVPTTLTIGIALVENAGGNAALALLLTVVTNISGILTVPFAIQWTIGSESEASINADRLLLKLLVTILIPLVVGKGLLETSTQVKGLVGGYSSGLSFVKNLACVVIVWLSSSYSQEELLEQKVGSVAALVLLCASIHALFLLFNFAAAYVIGLRKRELMAVVVMSSQKSFPVCLAVISYLDPQKVGDLGILTIPCIVAHMTQLFIDSLLLSKWKYINDFSLENV